MGFLAINLVNSITYRPVYNEYKNKFTEDEALDVFKKAGERYEELLSTYQDQDLPEAEKAVIRGDLLKGIAIYKTIKRKKPDDALKLMRDGIKATCRKRHDKYKKRYSRNWRRKLFVASYIARWKFFRNSERGYVHDDVVHDTKWQKMRVVVYGCPYKDFCEMEGVPELLPVFCEMEKQYYENIPKLIYHFSQSKGKDEDIKSCDIYMGEYQPVPDEKKKKKKEEEKKKRRDKWRRRFFFI